MYEIVNTIEITAAKGITLPLFDQTQKCYHNAKIRSPNLLTIERHCIMMSRRILWLMLINHRSSSGIPSSAHVCPFGYPRRLMSACHSPFHHSCSVRNSTLSTYVEDGNGTLMNTCRSAEHVTLCAGLVLLSHGNAPKK